MIDKPLPLYLQAFLVHRLHQDGEDSTKPKPAITPLMDPLPDEDEVDRLYPMEAREGRLIAEMQNKAMKDRSEATFAVGTQARARRDKFAAEHAASKANEQLERNRELNRPRREADEAKRLRSVKKAAHARLLPHQRDLFDRMGW
jgi:hypothetical protein